MPTDPKKPRKKKAVVISERPPTAPDNTFEQVFQANKKGFEKFYPEGVEHLNVYGSDQFDDAIRRAEELDADIIIQGHSGGKVAGIPIVNRPGEDKARSIAQSLLDAQNRGFSGSCTFGSCNFEDYADKIAAAGVTIPITTTPRGKKWFGPNLGNASSDDFNDFFFGLDKAGEKLSIGTINQGSGALDEITQFYNVPSRSTPNVSPVVPINSDTPSNTRLVGPPSRQQSVIDIANQF